MSLDLGGPALEIAIALAFVFFLLSLIASALTEWFAAAAKLRSKNLKKGLEGMLGDEKVVEQVLNHPLVRPDLRQKHQRIPSYLSPRIFAAAFLDLVKVSSADGKAATATVRVSEEGATSNPPVNGNLEVQLRTLAGAPSAALPSVPVVEKWFDESMDRVSGWYKRKAQLVTFLIAVVLAVGLNVSALRIAEQLSAEPNVRAAVVAKAEAAAQNPAAEEVVPKEGESKEAAQLTQSGEDMEKAVDDLAALDLPVFWAKENVPDWSWDAIGLALAGWLITALAVSLGAPFWFDALNKLSNLRLAGKRPEDKPAAQA
ncbi:MAG TPA: hypothetical protein VD761_12560 [Solirubrobacterales bacterium]|nr:hypothetical protein [Solirubrobacterales bacterium]